MTKPGPKPAVKEPWHPVQDLTEMQRRFCDYLAYHQGRTTHTKAAIEAGYSENSAAVEGCRLMKNPRARIRKREQIFVEFSDTVKKAQAQSEAMLVGLVGKAAEKNWTAAAWRLERKFPDKWGRTERNVATAQDDPLKDIAKQIEDLRNDRP